MKPVALKDLPRLMAYALWQNRPMFYGAARVQLEIELSRMIELGELMPRNPETFEPEAMRGDITASQLVLLVDDLQKMLSDRLIPVEKVFHG